MNKGLSQTTVREYKGKSKKNGCDPNGKCIWLCIIAWIVALLAVQLPVRGRANTIATEG
jgi:hypothetical protein